MLSGNDAMLHKAKEVMSLVTNLQMNILYNQMKSCDNEGKCVISSWKKSSESRREVGDHLAQYPHFTDEETKAQRIQFSFLRLPNYLGSQSKLGPAKTNRILNKNSFRSVTAVPASSMGYVFFFLFNLFFFNLHLS